MAQLTLPSGTLATETSADVGEIKIVKNIGNGLITTKSSAGVGAVGRVRSLLAMATPSLSPLTANIASSLSGTLKRKLKLPAGTIASTIVSALRFFLAAEQTPPPKGKLTLAGSSFAGSRLVKGDLIPLSFTITGQRLEGLTALYTAKRKDNPLAPTLVKANIHLTDVAIDPKTGIETMTGAFSIEPADTESFPDGEVELSYTFKLTDGLGRVYTLEKGSFTVFSA
ncbi:hypothetical protein [Iningainema tapete]|uniref:Uncharacterized protein n=1 Tax=Iningainema tapete BLCC-T55 TaxID=2748662 RepID=A0A8J6XD80_9CYAN|nr:hypothetical protein [Iningainema tapete]MBD2771143.1 hypothetical protein [Iningainema tapete BLCC-T55]